MALFGNSGASAITGWQIVANFPGYLQAYTSFVWNY